MHDGCSGSFTDGKAVLEKIRMMGFAPNDLPMPIEIECECGDSFEMKTFESKCPHCNMVYAVTPCHAFDASNVKKAGIEE